MNSDQMLPLKDAFRQKVEKLQKLPDFGFIRRISQMADDPNISMQKIAVEISKDMVLTSQLLKMVNSPAYGFPGKISTISQALILLGLDVLKALIVSSAVFGLLPEEAIPLWRHSLAVSRTSRRLSQILKLKDPEEFGTLGLLHDIGKAIFYIEAAAEYRALVNYAEKNQIAAWKAEHDILGFSHAETGQWVCQKWSFPEKLIAPIAFHHEPEKAEEKYQKSTLLIALANTLVKELGLSAENISVQLSSTPILAEKLGLTTNQLDDLKKDALQNISEIANHSPTDLL